MVQDMNINNKCLTGPGRWLVASLLLGWAAVGALAAGPKPAAATAAPAEPNSVVQQYDAATGVIGFVNFRNDLKIRDGLRMLADACQKNIVPTAAVDGLVAVPMLRNVTFEKALQAILGNNFKYEVDGDFVRVYTVEEYKKKMEDPSRMAVKVITLYYITAQEAMKLVQPVLSGSPAAKVQATTAAQKSISGGEGGSSSSSSSGSGSGGGGGLSSSGGGNDLAGNDAIVIYDFPENIVRAEKVIKELDVRPRQVLIEATILAARLTEDMQFGIDWNLLGGTIVNGFPATLGGQGTPIETFGFAQNNPAGLIAGFSAGNVQAIITALESITDTTLLANPKILAVNKQEGIVYIGRKIGYIDMTTQNQSGSTTQSVQFLETGTRLAFRPYIGDDGYIRMDIYPKDSDGTLKQNNIPDETSTELRTNVVVKDGQTVVIGGLFRDNVQTIKSQVPVLGDLPFVGVLFRGKKDTTSREEVIVILKPHIITEPAQTHPEQRLEDIRLKREGARQGLESIDSARIAEDEYARASRAYLEGDTGKALLHVRIALLARPTYLEALRLRERIIAETDPEQFKRLDSVAEQEVGKQQSQDWSRN